ncbi:MAG TPA: AAA family ATPase [Methylibium sp.]|uniref:AAA family ATPase n=1 Tax=Methylibium sp. TaxID=2067992 RepID=UPI002DBB9843|nr:AAA family ATPase [Methylibium sp.]HEU4458121.1 AAA family ATPase [Methylibium sp.]
MNAGKHVEARRLQALGFKLCALHPMSKRPVGDEWQKRPVDAIDDNASGYGMPLARNGLGSIDPDNVEPARAGFARCGFNLDDLMASGVRTTSTRPGSGGRSTFKVPPDLGRVVFSSKLHGTILELRAGQSNLQDCLPGTTYLGRDGAGPYEQRYAGERRMDDAPELPADFLAWWRRCCNDIVFLREQQALFSGEQAQLAISTGEGKGARLAFASSYRVEFNEQANVEDILARHGYSTDGGGRWAPSTATGTPCVRLIPGRDGLWQSDHASDPLIGTFDAWTAHVVLDHGGDLSAAEAAWRPRHDALVADGFDDVVASARAELERRVDYLVRAAALAGLPDGATDDLPQLAVRAEPPTAELEEYLQRISAAAGEEVKVRRSKLRVIRPSELAARPASRWHVKGVVPRGELVVVYGASGSGKSFVVWDLSAAVARGIGWRGRKVARGRVVYVVAEGSGGFAKRVEAYARHHRLPDLDAVGVELIVAAPNLLTDADPNELIREIGRADVIVLDTWAQVTPGSDENAGKDMGAALGRCKRIHEATGATILLVHHAGKDAAKGARGWSGLKAAADAELEVVRDPKGRRLRLSKSKDGEDGLEWGFGLEVVHLGVDDDLEPITSCVVTEAVAASTVEARKLTDNQRRVVTAVDEFAQTRLNGIPAAEVIAAAAQLMSEPEAGARDVRRQRAKEALRSLCAGDEALYSWGDDDSIAIL